MFSNIIVQGVGAGRCGEAPRSKISIISPDSKSHRSLSAAPPPQSAERSVVLPARSWPTRKTRPRFGVTLASARDREYDSAFCRQVRWRRSVRDKLRGRRTPYPPPVALAPGPRRARSAPSRPATPLGFIPSSSYRSTWNFVITKKINPLPIRKNYIPFPHVQNPRSQVATFQPASHRILH